MKYLVAIVALILVYAALTNRKSDHSGLPVQKTDPCGHYENLYSALTNQIRSIEELSASRQRVIDAQSEQIGLLKRTIELMELEAPKK